MLAPSLNYLCTHSHLNNTAMCLRVSSCSALHCYSHCTKYHIFSNLIRTLFTVLEGLKIGCVLNSWLKVGFWKNGTAALHAVRTIQYSKGKGHPITGHEGPTGGVEVQLYSFLTSALGGVGGQHHVLAALFRERSGTHCTGGLVGPRAGLDVCKESRPHGNSVPGPSSP
jgi:hypothetical protein